MKKKLFLLGTLAAVLAFGLVLVGCDDGNNPDIKKSFDLKGELKDLKVGQDVEPKKVVIYDNPKFEGKPLGEGVLGGGGSPSVLASHSIGGVSKSIDTTNPLTPIGAANTSWEISLTGISQNDSPELYFAITGEVGIGSNASPFTYPLDDFELPVSGISDGANFDINTGISGNNPFNDEIELEIIGIAGTVPIIGVNSADISKFGSGQDVWLMVYDGDVEIGGAPFSMAPRSAAENWDETTLGMQPYSENDYWTDNGLTKPSAGAVRYPLNSVDFNICIPAREVNLTLTFDLAFGDENSRTRANVSSGIGSYSLPAARVSTILNKVTSEVRGVKGIVLGTADITGKIIP